MGVRGDVLTEVQLCLVHSIAHSSLILLHEPHVASWEAEDEGMRKSLESADEILQAIFISLSESLSDPGSSGEPLTFSCGSPQMRPRR